VFNEKKGMSCVKKFDKKLKSPYALGPNPRGMIACVTKLMAKPPRLAASLAAYRFFKEWFVIILETELIS
jgi:hypothetical protein